MKDLLPLSALCPHGSLLLAINGPQSATLLFTGLALLPSVCSPLTFCCHDYYSCLTVPLAKKTYSLSKQAWVRFAVPCRDRCFAFWETAEPEISCQFSVHFNRRLPSLHILLLITHFYPLSLLLPTSSVTTSLPLTLSFLCCSQLFLPVYLSSPFPSPLSFLFFKLLFLPFDLCF